MEAGTFWTVSLFVNMGNEIALCDAICSGHVIGCCRYAGEIKACAWKKLQAALMFFLCIFLNRVMVCLT